MARSTLEQWLSMYEYPRYEISDFGRVRNGETGLVLKPLQNKNGYLAVVIRNRFGKWNRPYIHRLVLIAFAGLRKGFETDHINGVKTDNRLSNLEWVAHAENMKRGKRLGLMRKARGEESGKAKLTEDEVLQIRRMYPQKTQPQLANEFGVTHGLVSLIVNRKIWRHI